MINANGVGNVGIGTTNLLAHLHVASNTVLGADISYAPGSFAGGLLVDAYDYNGVGNSGG